METSAPDSPLVGAAVSCGLLSTPAWNLILHDISILLQSVSLVCGAIIGIATVVRLYKTRSKA